MATSRQLPLFTQTIYFNNNRSREPVYASHQGFKHDCIMKRQNMTECIIGSSTAQKKASNYHANLPL